MPSSGRRRRQVLASRAGAMTCNESTERPLLPSRYRSVGAARSLAGTAAPSWSWPYLQQRASAFRIRVEFEAAGPKAGQHVLRQPDPEAGSIRQRAHPLRHLRDSAAHQPLRQRRLVELHLQPVDRARGGADLQAGGMTDRAGGVVRGRRPRPPRRNAPPRAASPQARPRISHRASSRHRRRRAGRGRNPPARSRAHTRPGGCRGHWPGRAGGAAPGDWHRSPVTGTPPNTADAPRPRG